MIVKAEGNGYGDTYKSVHTDKGWVFQHRGGRDYLTAGIGRPRFWPAEEALLEAVKKYSGAKISIIDGSN